MKKGNSSIKQNRKYILMGCILILLVTCIIVILNKNNTLAVENDDYVTINCSKISEDKEIDCSIVLTTNSIVTEGLSANIKTSDDVSFENFTASEGWNSYMADEDGFSIVNFDGLKGSGEVAKLKYAQSDDSDYYIDLINVNISDGDKTYSLSDASSDSGRVTDKVNNDISNNEKTGDELIIVAIIGTLLAIAFSIYYFVKKRANN